MSRKRESVLIEAKSMLKSSLALSGRTAAMLAVVTGIAASLAHAEVTPIIDFTGGTAVGVIAGNTATAGFSFTVTTVTTISGLGFLDVGSNSLTDSHQVGLWTSSGTLLGSAVVDGSSTAVASTSNLGDWRETGISSLTLDPGSYVLGAFYRDVSVTPTEDQTVYHATGTSSVSGVGYGHAVSGLSGFVFPNGDDSVFDDAYFGPMAFTGDSSVAPEPASFGLSVGALLLGALAFRIRRRPASV